LPLLLGQISAACATGTSLLAADTCTRCLGTAAETCRHEGAVWSAVKHNAQAA
jgi:hypothetical protein